MVNQNGPSQLWPLQHPSEFYARIHPGLKLHNSYSSREQTTTRVMQWTYDTIIPYLIYLYWNMSFHILSIQYHMLSIQYYMPHTQYLFLTPNIQFLKRLPSSLGCYSWDIRRFPFFFICLRSPTTRMCVSTLGSLYDFGKQVNRKHMEKSSRTLCFWVFSHCRLLFIFW